MGIWMLSQCVFRDNIIMPYQQGQFCIKGSFAQSLCLCLLLKRASLSNLVVVFKFNGASSLMRKSGLAWDRGVGDHTTKYICDWKQLANKGHPSKTKTSLAPAAMYGEQQREGSSVRYEQVMQLPGLLWQLLVLYRDGEWVDVSELAGWTAAWAAHPSPQGLAVAACFTGPFWMALLPWLCEILPCPVRNHLGTLDLYCKMGAKALSISSCSSSSCTEDMAMPLVTVCPRRKTSSLFMTVGQRTTGIFGNINLQPSCRCYCAKALCPSAPTTTNFLALLG